MTERLNYGGGYNDDHDDEEEEQESQADDILWYRLGDPNYDPDEQDRPEGGLDDFQTALDQVDHQLDHAADDAAQLNAEARFGWRFRARLRRKGLSVPPDMTDYRWPTFVRLEDLQNDDSS